jgi:hypothetical protein
MEEPGMPAFERLISHTQVSQFGALSIRPERPLQAKIRGGPDWQELAVGSTDRRNTF